MSSEKVRVKERESGTVPNSPYELAIKLRKEFIDLQMTGKVVVRDEDREWFLTRQGRLKFYLNPTTYKDHALRDWGVFKHDIRNHTGKHNHQGGLVIFVLEGKGYSVVNGERIDWEEGDLILLPLLPDGCDHQHFNLDQEQGCKWIAFSYYPQREEVANQLTQKETSPEYPAQM